MDTSAIAGSALLMQSGQTQQALSVSMMKRAADAQNQMANMLAQNAQQAAKPAQQSGNGFNFSTYA